MAEQNSPASAAYVLQRTIFAPRDMPPVLYARFSKSKPTGDFSAEISPGGSVSSDTWFGTFYLAHWRRYGTLSDLRLRIDIEGKADIAVYRHRGGKTARIAQESTKGNGGSVVIDLGATLKDGGKAGRITFTIASAKGAIVMGASFVTTIPPAQPVHLSVGLCTFNQEARLARTLAALARLRQDGEATGLAGVYVVNHGPEFTDGTLAAALEATGAEVLVQANLGGCGGFVRTLTSAAADEQATHHLLMDDDIVLDERLILRSVAFLGHAKTVLSIGGPMLDLRAPANLIEAGAAIDPDNTVRPFAKNLDLSEVGSTARFDRVPPTHYNAWWFCIVPLQAARNGTLPLPLFIRGDDFDYAFRLARQGIATITLPGTGVWHEPFDARPPTWQTYYDLRNRLIFGGTNSDRIQPIRILRMVHLLFSSILEHDYRAAALRQLALRHYLNGPDAVLSRPADDIHAEVMSVSRRFSDPPLGDMPPHAKFQRPGWTGRGVRGLVTEYLRAMTSAVLLPHRRRPRFVEAGTFGPAAVARGPYVVTNARRDYFLHRRPARWRAVSQSAVALALLLSYRLRRKSACAEWAQSGHYAAPDNWTGIFECANPPPRNAARGNPG